MVFIEKCHFIQDHFLNKKKINYYLIYGLYFEEINYRQLQIVFSGMSNLTEIIEIRVADHGCVHELAFSSSCVGEKGLRGPKREVQNWGRAML